VWTERLHDIFLDMLRFEHHVHVVQIFSPFNVVVEAGSLQAVYNPPTSRPCPAQFCPLALQATNPTPTVMMRDTDNH
jgi:hypothetical protein